MTLANKDINVAIVPHPFAVERVHHRLPCGLSIAGIIAQLQPDPWLAHHAHVYLNGDYVPREQWAYVAPKAGAQLSIRLVPMGGGGGGKNPLRTVLSIAIMAGTAEIGGLAAGSSFMGFGLGGLVKAGLGLAGNLLLNALAPPPRPRFTLSAKQSPTLFIQGARNQATPFGRVPKVLGKHRFVPPLGAQPYTETVGNDQYLRMLFVWGYGPLDISDLKIGETPLSSFSDVQIETRNGYADDAPITLYTDNVIQDDLQAALTNADGYIIRTTDTDADEISVDITFPQGLFKFNSSDVKVMTSVTVSVDYAPAGSGRWTSAGTIAVTATQSTALRRGLQFAVTRGQYDVRLKRVTADSTSDLVYDDVVWTALRTIRYTQPINMKGIAVTALRIKATDQLNGVIERLNGVVQSVLPDWNGTDWSTVRATSNPASIFRHVLQGSANARPLADSRLDLGKLQVWHGNCTAASREFNAVIDYNISVADVLQDVAAAGRASPMLIDGKWAVVEDKQQTVPVQHFTPRNSFSFQGGKSFADLPQALRIRFINRANGWLQDERLVFDDGYDALNTTKYEILELPGITSSDQAWKDGRYHIATARLRPETYSFHADIEHIVCTRGDLIRFTHDVPLFGLMSARVKSVTVVSGHVTAVALDAAVTMIDGKSYAVRFRLSDGSSIVQSVVTAVGTTTTLTFTTPLVSGPSAGDLALFGESGQESVELIVKSITPQNDLNALIACVDAAPAVFTAESGTIPPFNSQISVPPEMLPPPAPVLSQIQSGSAVMIRNADGSLTSRIVITLRPPAYNAALDMRVLIRAAGETGYRPATVLAESANSISITDIVNGGIYDIRLYYVRGEGVLSQPLALPGYQVENSVPSDVTNFNMNVLDSTAYLSWSAITDIDLAYYTLRFAPQTSGVTWSSATDLISQISAGATSVAVPAAVGTFLLKAVNTAGRQSTNADVIVSTIAGLAGFNAVTTVIEDSAFAGIKTNVGIGSADLRLSGNDSIDYWADIDTVADVDIGNNGLAVSGIYAFSNSVDLGAIYTSRLTVDMTVVGIDKTTSVDTWADIDNQESWDQTVDPSLWNVQLQLRMTNDNPAGSPTWSGWMPFVIGDYAARAFQFRALFSSDVSGITPSVARLRIDVDMPDRTISGRNIATLAGGSAIAFANAFRATPAISITAQNMATGDYYTITSPSASGFTIQFFNSTNTGISRTFDYLAKGYGQQG